MKKLLFIGFFIIVLFETACVQREQSDIYDKVERYMEIYPDSALLLLNQLPHPEKLRGENSADYALLLTQARDKNYLDSLQSDSLIKIAVDYYRGRGNKVKEGKALFYYGKVMAMKDEPTVAMQAYLDAEKVLEGTSEYRQQMILREYIGYLNYDLDMYDIAIDNYQKSLYYGEKVNDMLRVAFAYRNIAQAYIAKQNVDSACWYAECGIAFARKDAVTQVLPSLLQILGIAERDKGDYSSAIDHFLSAIKLEKDSDVINHYYFSLGDIYMQIGQYENAKSCFEKGVTSKQLFTRAGAYNYLSLLEKKRKNYIESLHYREKSDSLLYITQNENLRSQILTLQRKYEHSKLIMEKKRVEQNKQIQLYVLLSAILLIIVLGGVSFILLRKRYMERFKRNLKIIKDNKQTINKYIYELEKLKLKESQTVESNKEKIGKLNQKVLLLTNENKVIRENICVNAVFLLDQLKKRNLIVKRMSREEKLQIFEYMDLLFGNFISRMRQEYNLTENNTMLVALLKIGFSSKELAFVFECEMNSVFKMKQRLRDRLHLDSDSKLDEFIMSY